MFIDDFLGKIGRKKTKLLNLIEIGAGLAFQKGLISKETIEELQQSSRHLDILN